MQDRTDNRMAGIVRRGIVIDAGLGSVRAWSYMTGYGVPEPVISRVLRDLEACRIEDKEAREQGAMRPYRWLRA